RPNEYRIVLDNEDLAGEGGGSMVTPPSVDAPTGGSNLTPPSSRPRAHGGSAGAPTGGSIHAPTVVAPAREDPLLDPSLDPSLDPERGNDAPDGAPPFNDWPQFLEELSLICFGNKETESLAENDIGALRRE